MKTVRRPPYPKWNPGYFPCSSLTPPSAFLTPSIGVLRWIRAYPPGHVSITHAENVQEHWYDVTGGILGYDYELVDRITPIDILPEWFILGVVVGIPLMFSLPSIWQKRPQIVLSVGLALWFAALIGNKGEIWLFGHVTDWIWVNYGSFGKITNLADVMILVVFVLVLVTPRSKDNRKPRGDLPNTGVT